jgi:hypothetical protein
MESDASLRRLLAKHGLEGWAPQILGDVRPAIRMRASNKPASTLGCSRFGGARDLPDAGCWPLRGGRPLSFLAQINCVDVHGLDAELTDEHYGGATVHQLLGHPLPVQGDMTWECQLAFNGVYCGKAVDENDPHIRSLAAGAAAWRLPCQFDSDDDLGTCWGASAACTSGSGTRTCSRAASTDTGA